MKNDFFEKAETLSERWCKLDYEKEIVPEIARMYLISCFVLGNQPKELSDCLTPEQKIDLESVVNQDKCCIHQEYKDRSVGKNQESIEVYFLRMHRFLDQSAGLFRETETHVAHQC